MSLEDDNNFALERLMEQYKTRELNRQRKMNQQDNKQSTAGNSNTTFLGALKSLETAFLKVFEGFDVKDNKEIKKND